MGLVKVVLWPGSICRNELRDIFLSRYNYSILESSLFDSDKKNIYDNIIDDIREGLFSISYKPITINPNDWKNQSYNESIEHNILKNTAKKEMEKLGETNIEFEYNHYGVRYDVYGGDLKIRAECGNTLGVRLYENTASLNEFWLLPFSDYREYIIVFFKINNMKIKERRNKIKLKSYVVGDNEAISTR